MVTRQLLPLEILFCAELQQDKQSRVIRWPLACHAVLLLLPSHIDALGSRIGGQVLVSGHVNPGLSAPRSCHEWGVTVPLACVACA